MIGLGDVFMRRNRRVDSDHRKGRPHFRVVSFAVVVALVGCLVGCGAVVAGGETGMGGAGLSGSGGTGSGSGQGVANSGRHNDTLAPGADLKALKSMPSAQVWQKVLPSRQTLSTSYGLVTASRTGISRSPLTVTLSSDHHVDTLYKIAAPSWKTIVQWTVVGRFLAVELGFPPNSHPQTGDFQYRVVVINLVTRDVAVTRPAEVQTTAQLVGTYLALNSVVFTGGEMTSYLEVIDLLTDRHVVLIMPEDALTSGVLTRDGRVAYLRGYQSARTPTPVSVSLPTSGWTALGTWHPEPL